MTMSEPMSDERLGVLVLSYLPLVCDGTSEAAVRECLAEIKRLRTENDRLVEEWEDMKHELGGMEAGDE